MQQYFINEKIDPNQILYFSKEQENHISKVLRMREGEIVKVVDTEFQPYLAKIHFHEKQLYASIFEKLKKQEENLKITLIQGMIKKEKWELLIQKCCELGVTDIVPMISSRTVVKVSKDDLKKKERYNKIALEACEQCKRDSLVKVATPIRYHDITKYKSELNIIAYEEADFESMSLKQLLNQYPEVKSITFIIGSEGGFSQAEVEYAKESGFLCVSLGKRILRAETAAMAVVNITHYHLD